MDDTCTQDPLPTYLVIDRTKVHICFQGFSGDSARQHVLAGVAESILHKYSTHVFNLVDKSDEHGFGDKLNSILPLILRTLSRTVICPSRHQPILFYQISLHKVKLSLWLTLPASNSIIFPTVIREGKPCGFIIVSRSTKKC